MNRAALEAAFRLSTSLPARTHHQVDRRYVIDQTSREGRRFGPVEPWKIERAAELEAEGMTRTQIAAALKTSAATIREKLGPKRNQDGNQRTPRKVARWR